MSQHSKAAELPDVVPSVPLSERPLVSSGENTVVRNADDSDSQSILPLNPDGKTLRDQLFPPPDADSRISSGVRLGHFEVQQQVGAGGMGAVFKAIDLELARTVALKILHPAIAADPSMVARFRNEARSCAQLNHDNIARVFYIGEQDGLNFIAYEYAEGCTIRDLIHERGVLTVAESVNYAIQATLGLNHLFAGGIVHRDIKPSNIILTESGRVKIVDLGLARRDTTDSIGDITVAGTTLGTFDYISPEQARDPRTADIRSDIYSLGCTIYHMLTGQPPYPEGTALQKLLDHQGKTPPDPRSLNREVPTQLGYIVQKMMNTDPDHRYLDPGQLLVDLIDLAASIGLSSVPAEGIVWRRIEKPSIRQVSGSVFLLAAVLVICTAALIIQFAPLSDTRFDGSGPTSVNVLSPNSELVPATDGNSPVSGSPVATDSKGRNSKNATDGSVAAQSSQSDPANVGDAIAVSSVSPFLVTTYDQTELPAGSLGEAFGVDNVRTIKLQFDGPPPKPWPRNGMERLNGKSVKLVAGDGWHPVLEFSGAAGSGAEASMFKLINNSSLALDGIDIRIIPDEAVSAGQWAVFECDGPNRVVLNDVSIHVVNPIPLPTSVFHFVDSTVTDPASTEYQPADAHIDINRFAVRGTGDLFYIAGQTQGLVELRNSGIALNGILFNTVGSSSMRHEKGRLQIQLSHVTTVLSQPLIDLQDSNRLDGAAPERVLPSLSVAATACVFASTAEGVPMVQSRGNNYLDVLRNHLTWTGATNLYHGYAQLWQLESGGLESDSATYDFSGWREYWNSGQTGMDNSSAEIRWTDAPWRIDGVPVDFSAVDSSWLTLDRQWYEDQKPSLPKYNSELPGALNLPRFTAPGSGSDISDIVPAPISDQ